MQVTCSRCPYSTEIDASLLPAGGMEGVCPQCRTLIPLGNWQAAKDPAPAQSADSPAPVDALPEELPEEGRVSIITIIALICLIDSTLSLLGRVPGLFSVLGGGTGLSFHQQAKYLYDTLMAAGFFVSAFGLLLRKNWARIALICLFGLGLAEGLYLIAYQQSAIADLENNLHEDFSELKKQQNAKLVGCAVYAFFLFKLMTRTVRARFRD